MSAPLLQPLYNPVFKPTGLDGMPLPGGKLYTYAAGTTTPLAAYNDADGTAPLTNPIILDADGEATVFLGNNVYKFALTDANDVPQWTVDEISALRLTDASSITGVLNIAQIPDIPLSKVTVDVNPDTKFFYQDVYWNSASQTQRKVLNFISPFVVTDNNTIPSTDITFANSGVVPGTYTNPTITVEGSGRVTAASNGSGFPARVDDANGSSLTFPDGTCMKWGVSPAAPTGVPKGTASVTFPGGAFTVPPSVTVSPDNNPTSSSTDPIECHLAGPATVNGFTVVFTCPVLIGGSGASNITQAVHANWEAKGH